jgi:hypothetical protein
LKKGKWRASDEIKVTTIFSWKSQAGQWVGMQWYVSQNSGAGFEGELNNIVWPYSVLRKRRFSGFLSL